MLHDFSLAYGDTFIPLSLAGNVQTLDARPFPALGDISKAFLAAVENPVGSPKLKEMLSPGDEVTIIISDITRFWMRQDVLCPLLVNYLNQCGIGDENITFLVALGTHRPQSQEELKRLVSPGVYDRVQVINHDAWGPLTYVGTTTRGTRVEVNPLAGGRKVIILGGTVHHFFAGYGGGRKSILPGVSGAATITQNHLHTLDPVEDQSNPLTGCGLLGKNPVHEDMVEAAAMVAPVFSLNVVCDGEGQHVALVGGHWQKAWEESCRIVNQVAGVPLESKADIVVASCGGFPKDINLYQGAKSLLNAAAAVKEGGTLLLLARCNEGGGPPEFFDWCTSPAKGTLYQDLRAGYTISGYIFYLCCAAARHINIRLLTEIPADVLAPMGIHGVSTAGELLQGIDMQGKDIIVMPHAGGTVPLS